MKPYVTARIGVAILRTLARHALKRIPLVGPAFELTEDVVNAVRREMEGAELRTLTDADLMQAIRAVAPAEAVQAVATELDSADGTAALQNLNDDERELVRRRLLDLPGEFDQLLGQIEAREREQAAAAAAADRQQRADKLASLRGPLKAFLAEGQYPKALATVEEMLTLAPGDRELRRTEAFLIRRVPNAGPPHGCLMLWLIGFTISWIGPFAERTLVLPEEVVFSPLFIVTLLAAAVHLLLVPWTWTRLPRWLRRNYVVLSLITWPTLTIAIMAALMLAR